MINHVSIPYNEKVRTRFAPSPTGDLHLGSVRTALYAWLYAKHYQGQFILRIEDTDPSRSTPEAIKIIEDALDWLELDYDEGPYFQSERTKRYQIVVNQLLKENKAYYCYCSTERLKKLKTIQIANGQKPQYDRLCRDKSLDASTQPHVIRFKNPQTGIVDFEDKIIGHVKFQNLELDDFVLMRSDGSFTYNFSVVIDDNDMAITHVIRGNDHLNNTPRQINLLRALDANVPVYMHLPMIHSENGKKLSKRENASSIIKYREAGFLPEAILNYLVRLGWSHNNQERFSRQEIIDYFDGSHISKSPAQLNNDKLIWLNKGYLQEKESNELVHLLKPFTQDWNYDQYKRPALSEIVAIQKERAETLKILAEKSRVFYEMPVYAAPKLTTAFLAMLELVYERLSMLKEWDRQSIYHVLTRVIKHYQVQPRELFQILRLILLGTNISPPIDITLALLERERVLGRLKHAIWLNSN